MNPFYQVFLITSPLGLGPLGLGPLNHIKPHQTTAFYHNGTLDIVVINPFGKYEILLPCFHCFLTARMSHSKMSKYTGVPLISPQSSAGLQVLCILWMIQKLSPKNRQKSIMFCSLIDKMA